MLEKYFVRPGTVDRVRASWIGVEIERYVESLDAQGYSWKSVVRRVPPLVEFGGSPGLVVRALSRICLVMSMRSSPSVSAVLVVVTRGSSRRFAGRLSRCCGWRSRGLSVVVGGIDRGRSPISLSGFMSVRPLSVAPRTIESYEHHLARFESYLDRIGVGVLSELSPAILTAFVAERGAAGLSKAFVRDECGVLRVFLRYTHREGANAADLSGVMDRPQFYRLASIPRPITWEEVGRVLGGVDRRTACGKRDWAIFAVAGDVWAARPRGRRVDAGRHRLEARAPGGPGAQGGALDRVPALSVPSGRHWWTTSATGGRRPPAVACSSGRSRQSSRSPPQPSHLARGTTSTRPVSRCRVPVRTRCGTPACSGSSTPTSRSRRSATSSDTAPRG
jgi:Phage integrase, N-terminal SAM-like domain